MAGGSMAGMEMPGGMAGIRPGRHRTAPWEWCPRSRRNPADGPRPRPIAACRAGPMMGTGDCPRLEHTVELQAQVIMQPGRVVLLDYEAEARRPGRRSALGFPKRTLDARVMRL